MLCSVRICKHSRESKSTCSRCTGGPGRRPTPSPYSVGGAVGGGEAGKSCPAWGILSREGGDRPGYVQGGQEAECGYLLLGIHYRRIPGDTGTYYGLGWPLLTVETEANGDSKGTNERDPSSWLVRWALHRIRYFICPPRPASWGGSRAGSPVS